MSDFIDFVRSVRDTEWHDDGQSFAIDENIPDLEGRKQLASPLSSLNLDSDFVGFALATAAFRPANAALCHGLFTMSRELDAVYDYFQESCTQAIRMLEDATYRVK